MIKLNYLESNFNFIFLEVFRRAKHDNEFLKKKELNGKKSCFLSVILALVPLQGVLLPAIP